jgi:hypothetical protein
MFRGPSSLASVLVTASTAPFCAGVNRRIGWSHRAGARADIDDASAFRTEVLECGL